MCNFPQFLVFFFVSAIVVDVDQKKGNSNNKVCTAYYVHLYNCFIEIDDL